MKFFMRALFLDFFWKKSIFRIFKSWRDNSPALRVLAREPGWRFTARCHNTKTVPKRGRLGARTQILLTIKIKCLSVIASRIALDNSIISSSYVFRFRMELVISRNARAISEFYLVEVFHEGAIFEIFFEKVEIFQFLKKCNGYYCSCSTSSRAGTRLTVHRALPSKTVAKRDRLGARTQILLTMEIMFLSVKTSRKCLWIIIISLSYVLRLWI